MPTLRTRPMQNSAILRLNSERDQIQTDPVYQRRGEVWNTDKRQLLLDSILNDYDLPKIYFHAFSDQQKKDNGGKFEYAVIDGRQRLEAIWLFIDGSLTLADDFIYLADPEVRAAGLTYSDLAVNYPKLKIRFDSFSLPIILVETDDVDLIEDMFSRLNEAVPLNAAEKRNALGGPMAQSIRDLAGHIFFAKYVRFSDRRYQHREVAARLLFMEYSIEKLGKIIDTKKPYLDDMVVSYKENLHSDNVAIYGAVSGVMDCMCNIFAIEDVLLRAQGVITVYFLLVRGARQCKKEGDLKRSALLEFMNAVERNRAMAEEDITKANFDLLEYDRMSQQGTNDAASIKERVGIVAEYLGLLEIKNYVHAL